MPHTLKAFDWLERNHDVFGTCGSMLYVGFKNGSSLWWRDTFGRTMLGTTRFGLVEVFEPNYREAVLVLPDVVCVNSDVRTVHELFRPGSWDMVFWDHGPEHVPTDDLVAATPRLRTLAGRWLLYCCPWGVWPQGSLYGNEHERHHTVVPETFEGLGMTTVRLGEVDQSTDGTRAGELIAYVAS